MIDVSVVVLDYNYARFLPDAIASALGQSHESVQVVVVDDGSTDDSAEVIAGFGSAVTAVRHDRNRGQGAAINSGAAAATGDLVWFLDADDLLLPSACARAAAALAAEPGLAKFHTPLAVVDGDGRWGGATLPGDPDRLATGDIADHVFRFRAHGWPPMSGNAYSRRALDLVLPVPEETYRQAADSFLNEQVAICGPIARSVEPLAAYRRHGGNQFAGTPLGLDWLRTKLGRELCSHDRLGRVAARLGLDGYRSDPDAVQDVAFLGYRLASLRLDPGGHPPIGAGGRDRRSRLAVAGIRAALANPELARSDRLLRSAWFATVASLPGAAARRLLAWYLPDGPAEPIWRRARRRLAATGPGRDVRPRRAGAAASTDEAAADTFATDQTDPAEPVDTAATARDGSAP